MVPSANIVLFVGEINVFIKPANIIKKTDFWANAIFWLSHIITLVYCTTSFAPEKPDGPLGHSGSQEQSRGNVLVVLLRDRRGNVLVS